MQVGQHIREDGPPDHKIKAGTPTMGGCLILPVIALSTLLWVELNNLYVWLVLFVLAAFGFIGFLDDYLKTVRKSSRGLIARAKFSLQVLVALFVSLILYFHTGFDSQLYFPFFKTIHPDLGWGYIVLSVFIIVGTSNAVNLTDGLDGLATGPIVIAFTTYLVFAYLVGHARIATYLQISYLPGAGELTVICGAVYDDWGGPRTYPHFAAGWAIAGNTPFMWAKKIASNYGGTRNGLVVSWPKGLKANNQIRPQWHHVIDIAPTILEAAGLPEPKSVNGVVQEPIEGVSMLYAFNDSNSADRRKTQYFEIAGNRAIYSDGWFAGVIHRAPWEPKPRRPLLENKWEIYDTRNDFSLTNDLAASNPEKLKEMQELFMSEAIKYRVLPIDDGSFERQNAALAGRPDLMGSRTSLTLWPGMIGMSENVFVNIKNRSFSITADLDIPESGAEGVILSQGGHIGGWSLYLKNSKPVFTYNFLSLEETRIAASGALQPGKNTVRVNFDYDGGGLGKGGTFSILVNGKLTAKGRIERTQSLVFSADETAGVGIDEATTVTTDYKQHDNAFTGKILKVVVDVKPIGEAIKLEEAKSLEEMKYKKALSG